MPGTSTETFTRTERYPKSIKKADLQVNCDLLRDMGAVSCQIIEQANSWIVASEWNRTPPGNPGLE